ncbi:MAG: sugar nucleotide-binding protein [Ilumatobacteraceae bacterium]
MFVTGGRGLLGRHLQRSPAIATWELIAPGSRALDIRQRERVIDEIREWKPKCVVHLAYRNDDRRTIVDGSRNVAEAAAACGARLIHLSTDVVFAGRAAPYVESDPTFAITEYGTWKAEAELAVQAACPTAVVVRTSLMYATDSLAPMQVDVHRAARGESRMSFFSDEYRCPAHAADVADACGALASMPHVTGPLHVAGPQVLSRLEIATAIAQWLGLNPTRLRSATLADSGLVRPARIALDVSKAASLGIRCRPMSATLH